MTNKETPAERRKRELHEKTKHIIKTNKQNNDYTINEAITHADESECWG